MFNLFGGKQRKLTRELEQAYRKVLKSPDARIRVQAADYALSFLDLIEPWPFEPNRRLMGAILHAAKGMAYVELMESDPVLYSPLSIKAYELAEKLFKPEDGRDWARFLNGMSLAHADRIDGNPIDNLEKAIELAETALASPDSGITTQTKLNLLGNLGRYYRDRTIGDAEENHQKSVGVFEELVGSISPKEQPVLWANAAQGLGATLVTNHPNRNSASIEKGIDYLLQAVKIYKKSGSGMELAIACSNLASAYSDRIKGVRSENLNAAVLYSELALGIFTPDNGPQYYANTKCKYGMLLADCKTGDIKANLEKAIAALDDAQKVYNKKSYPNEYLKVLYDKARIRCDYIKLTKRGSTRDSVRVAQELVDALVYEHNPKLWIRAQSLLGNQLLFDRTDEGERSNNIEQAIAVFEGAIDKIDADSDPSLWAMLTMNMANALAERVEGDSSDNLDHSIQLHERSLEKMSVTASPENWGRSMRNLAVSYMECINGSRADNIEMSIVLLEEALVVVTSLNYTDLFSEIMEAYGDSMSQRIRGKREDNMDDASMAFGLASRFREKRGSHEALMRLRQKTVSFEVEQLLEKKERGESEAGLHAEERDGNPVGEFIASIQEANARIDRSKDPRTWASGKMEEGDLLIRLIEHQSISDYNELLATYIDRFSQAIECFTEALSALSQYNDRALWLIVSQRIASTSIAMHNLRHMKAASNDQQFSCGSDDLKYAIDVIEVAISRCSISKSPMDYMELAVKLGEAYALREEWSNADDAFLKAGQAANLLLGDVETSREETLHIVECLGKWVKLAPIVAIRRQNYIKAVQYSEIGRARLLGKALGLRGLPFDEQSRIEIEALQTKLVEQERKLASGRLVDRRTPLEETIRLRRKIRECCERLVVHDELDSNSLHSLIEYLRDSGNLIALPFVSEKQGRIVLVGEKRGKLSIRAVPISDSKSVSELGNRVSNSDLRTRHPNGANSTAIDMTEESFRNFLGEVFFEPILEKATSSEQPNVTHIVFIPQGRFATVPFGLARRLSTGESLVDTLSFSVSPSINSLNFACRKLESISKPCSVAIVANPKIEDMRYRPLPYADTEGRLASSWFESEDSGAGLSGEDANFEAVLSSLESADVWHFATHGIFCRENPLQSSLHLSGQDKLTLESLFNATEIKAPRLVICSACSTGVFSGEKAPDEFIGLVAGFLQLGALGVIATLWEVSDLASCLLIGRFYELYLGHETKPPEALRKAQLWLKTATVEDFCDQLSNWQNEERLYVDDAEKIRDFFVSKNLSQNDVPFSDPIYWGAFSYYGI